MTSAVKTQFTQHVYDDCNPNLLRELRQASGLEVSALAKTACLSLAQVEQLEQGGDGLFYNLTIKRQAYKRLLMILGAEPPSVSMVQEEVAEAALPVSTRASEQALDGIIALSHDLPRLVSSPLHALWSRVNVYAWGGLCLLALAVWGFGTTRVFESVPSPVVDRVTVMPPSLEQSAAPKVVASVEMAVVSGAQVAASSSLAGVASQAASGCVYSADVSPEVEPASPKKAGNYVYLISSTDTQVCVVDGHKVSNLVELKAGEGRSVYGPAPWQVSGKGLGSVQMYFQGWRVMPPEGASTRFTLVEKPLP